VTERVVAVGGLIGKLKAKHRNNRRAHIRQIVKTVGDDRNTVSDEANCDFYSAKQYVGANTYNTAKRTVPFTDVAALGVAAVLYE
jgi:hypothetical protein